MTTGEPLTPARAVLFDWDNTLVDNWACVRNALNATLVALGHQPWDDETIDRSIRQSARDMFPVLFGDRWREALEIFYATFAERHLTDLVPLPGAEAMLRQLANDGVLLGVVSNKDGRYLRVEAEALGWGEMFHAVVGAGDSARDKPDPAPVGDALSGSGISTGPEVWFLGDAAVDMECARNSGCTGILVQARTNRVEPVDPTLVKRMVEDCNEFCVLVQAARKPIWFSSGR